MQSLAIAKKTPGNPSVHIILRGGSSGGNYGSNSIHDTVKALREARPDFHPSIVVDCSRM